MSGTEGRIEAAWRLACEAYAEHGVDAEAALARLSAVPLSIHCWQGDDVRGFEAPEAALGSGGLMVTGAHPGRARDGDELRADLEAALALVPGPCRVNLHAIYAETGGRAVPRDALDTSHFARWIGWAKARGVGLDMNPTFFAHPLAAAGFTLSSPDEAVRGFWVGHGRACRRIAAAFARETPGPCALNVWIPDGMKDETVERAAFRARLAASLDEVFAGDPDTGVVVSLEPKLFGLGSEACVVGSHEFYLCYAMARKKALCLDLGHFHPTESVADKISALLPALPSLLLHVSRGVRWDSDHVAVLDDDLRAVAAEVVRGRFLDRVAFALDYFDATVNRVAAWVVGARAARKALLVALLEPLDRLRAAERAGDLTARLALLEEARALPSGAVWDWFCLREGVPPGAAWLPAARAYGDRVSAARR